MYQIISTSFKIVSKFCITVSILIDKHVYKINCNFLSKILHHNFHESKIKKYNTLNAREKNE